MPIRSHGLRTLKTSERALASMATSVYKLIHLSWAEKIFLNLFAASIAFVNVAKGRGIFKREDCEFGPLLGSYFADSCFPVSIYFAISILTIYIFK